MGNKTAYCNYEHTIWYVFVFHIEHTGSVQESLLPPDSTSDPEGRSYM